MSKVLIFLAEGFEEIEAITVIDIMRRAEINISVVSITDDYMVDGAHGIRVETDDLIKNIKILDQEMMVLPGGMPGTKNLNSNTKLHKIIDKFNKEGKYLAAICAAPMIYGQLGLLEGREAVCYPGFENYLKGAKVSTENVIQSGNIITSRGVGTSLEFALKLVEILKGSELKESLKKGILL